MPHFLYLFLRWCPGVLGILLRQKLYSRLLRRCGRNALIGRYVDLKNPRAIMLGDDVILNDYACLDASRCTGDEAEAAIVLGDKVFIGASTTLSAGPGRLTIREGCNIGSGCTLLARHRLTLGHHALLAGFCAVGDEETDAEREQNGTASPLDAPGTPAEIHTRLGSGCWLGLRSRIASGIEIGEGAIVGAHSVVVDSLPAYVIAFGQPAGVVRNRP